MWQLPVLCLTFFLTLIGSRSQDIYREDRLALLSGTLRTFQLAKCDGEKLQLECPPGTTISINLVQYGRLASRPSLCGHPDDMLRFNNTDCMDRTALRVVATACSGQRRCNVATSPQTFGVDPCPGIRKFVEVLYKCRPNEFRTEVVCQGDTKRISCNMSRIAIYSAKFGTSEYGSLECPQAPGVKLTNCFSSFTSEKMINKCQGRHSCELDADPAFFQHRCPPDHSLYLKTTYTCVPREILRDKYSEEPDPEPEAAPVPSTTTAAPLPPPFDHNWVPPPLPADKNNNHIGASDAPSTPRSGKNNKEKFILYLTLSITGGLLLCLVAVIARLYCQRQRARHESKAHYIGRPAHSFADDISEVDADIDLGPTVLSSGRMSPQYTAQLSFNGRSSREPPEVVRYASSSGRGTLRGAEGDTNPRSLSRGAPNVYYYS